MNQLLAALFLVPSSWYLPAPGTVSLPVPAGKIEHLRYHGPSGVAYWTPPSLALPKPGTYWVSAATKAALKKLPAAQFNALLDAEGLDMVSTYRQTYKLGKSEGRFLTTTYAKTLLSVGAPPEISPVALNLPIEILLRYPTLLEVRFRGAPTPNLLINVNGKPLGRTNGAGQLPIPNLPPNAKLSASIVRSYPDHSTADWEIFTATLSLP